MYDVGFTNNELGSTKLGINSIKTFGSLKILAEGLNKSERWCGKQIFQQQKSSILHPYLQKL
jgi:hypothetical protein